MAKTDDNQDARKRAATPSDPVKALIRALHDEGVNGDARVAARREFSAIADGGRAWEQLPSGMKAAARADMRRLADAGETESQTGYSARTTERLLRDIGKA